METLEETVRDPMSPTQPLYRLADVFRYYEVGSSQVRAVDHIDLELFPGELVAIEGPSGSGKSTMLQLLGALDRPTGGSVVLGGRDLAKLNDSDLTDIRAKEIGFVFQSFNLIPTLTASENVEVAMVPVLSGRAARQERAARLLGQVGLAGRSRHLPLLLSGGEQQRVAIARAMANHPRVLLADEPTGNLDTKSSEEIGNILRALAADQGVTVILVTHSDSVASWASRRLRMRDGRLTEVAVADLAPATPTELAPAPGAQAVPPTGITGVHLALSSPEAEALRTSLRDVFGLASAGTSDGLPVFALPPAELGVNAGDAPSCQICLTCRDLASTVMALKAQGVKTDGRPVISNLGTGIMMELPGGIEVLLCEPTHQAEPTHRSTF